MIAAGIDVGSLSTKVVILKNKKILSVSILSTGDEGSVMAEKAMESALKTANLSIDKIDNIVATGYARKMVHLAKVSKSDTLCHSKGAYFFFPSAKTVISVGAESSKIIKLDKNGNVQDFAGNDKCASGTGIFLDTMAKALEISIEDMGQLSLNFKEKATISNMCAVFAESEVVSHVHRGTRRNDILAGIHESIAERIVGMSNRVGITNDVILTGGVAKNIGLVKAIEEKLEQKVYVPQNPLITGALGAALVAAETG